ncbi:hydrogenase large subunit [Butyrivibrio sp. MC2013]|uniref:hydrogenase large subunit n=1 Tax=Butyrivibrio sp. MC2013 TaxID=1280686 RepID=UPI0003F4FF80|nr:nickel-dependent hydrogenase large subunit [Butyrivibrio sp. MC2013]
MGKKSVVPFGPQHPVLPEPIHLDLVIEDEIISEAIPNIGFIHRGLEGLVEKKDFNEMVYIAERTCGICSFGHGLGYVEAIEHVMNIEVPARARYLRTIWAELGRMHSHLLWLGLAADAFGFESLFYESWRIRERILDLHELTCGSRLIFSVNKVGGVIRDIPADKLAYIKDQILIVEKEVKNIEKTFLGDYSVQTRSKGIGLLTKEEAHDLGAVGPFARASGITADLRTTGYAAYGELDFEPVISNDGDCYARLDVRIRELYQSIDLIRQAIDKIPEGELEAKAIGFPKGEYFMRIEQPRGEAVYYVKGNGTKILDRMRIRTPTFANIPPLCETLKGADYADVGPLVVSIDPCISCTER